MNRFVMNILQKTISIKTKAIIIVSISVIVLMALIYTISTAIVSKNYLDIEKNDVIQNLQRADDSISDTISQLSIKLNDWSSWDDTYQFIQDKNKAYIDSNLKDNAFQILGINAMVFVNIKDEVIYKKVFDLKSGQEISSENILSHIASHKKLITYENVNSFMSGIIILPEGPLLIASRPVLSSDGQGPIQGSLIFGKFLSDELVESIGNLTHLSIKIYTFDSTFLSGDVLAAKLQLSKGDEYVVNPLSADVIAGYKILYDLYGNPIEIIKIDTPRHIYIQARSTQYFFMGVVSALIILFGAILIFLFEKFVISRLLKERTIELEKAKSGLEKAVAERTVELEKIKSELEKTVAERTEKLNNKLIETEGMNKLMIDRELKMVELKEEIEELKKLGL